jgi:hypothetical protein
MDSAPVVPAAVGHVAVPFGNTGGPLGSRTGVGVP